MGGNFRGEGYRGGGGGGGLKKGSHYVWHGVMSIVDYRSIPNYLLYALGS